MELLKRTWAEISLDNLAYNYSQLRKLVPASTKFLGVVKADAYGHGAVEISQQLAQLGAAFLAVSNIEEAVQLRNGAVQLPILVLGYVPAAYAQLEADQQIRQEVHCLEYARQLNTQLKGTGKRLKIHLKLDTGMSRLGFFAYDCAETIAEIAEIAAMPHLQIEGVFTHFAVADALDDESRRYTKLQYTRFCNLLEQMKVLGIQPELRHCCNSAATILYPEFAMDMIRPGIATYGYAPSEELEGKLELRPLLSLRTSIAQIKTFAPEITVSYGRQYTTPGERKIAVAAIGYADGLSRVLSGKLRFLLHGKRVQQVGRICMDMCMVDITDVPEAEVGDTLTVIGTEHGQSIPCQSLADQLGTIVYEVTCGINKRVPRIFLRDGQVVDALRYIV